MWGTYQERLRKVGEGEIRADEVGVGRGDASGVGGLSNVYPAHYSDCQYPIAES